ncbi:MAG TPA: 4a-hydroxytetrahydrobiopterin dehydratase [Sulfurivirga caldicuralii]|nr:4a-hydroxytetrahydrobiopterin dehydratase [Sulfurivirga caldicuralii]
MNERWKQKDRPPSLEARFEFEDFERLRMFLDDIADHADNLQHHPNITFSRRHVSIVIYPQSESIGDIDLKLAKKIDDSYNRIQNQ